MVLGTSFMPVRVMASLSARAVALKADSALWWSLLPCSTSTCSVTPASVAKLWKTWGIISQLSSPIFSRVSCSDVWQYGRDDRSTTARASDSSSGAWPVPKRRTPRIGPSACLKAAPSASAQSSAVWWSSIHKSPSHFSSSDRPPCLASVCSICSKPARTPHVRGPESQYPSRQRCAAAHSQGPHPAIGTRGCSSRSSGAPASLPAASSSMATGEARGGGT